MKKITPHLILIVLFACCQKLMAQERYVDLRIEFRSPTPYTTIKSPQVIMFSFVVINKGMDTLYQDDSLTYRPGHSLGTTTPTRILSIPGTIVPGDSFTVTDTMEVNSTVTMSNFTIGFTKVPLAFGDDKGHDKLRSELLEDRVDNNPSLVLNHIGISGIEQRGRLLLKAYPNPCQGNQLSVKYDNVQRIASVEVLTGTGQQITDQIRIQIQNDLLLLEGFSAISSGIYYLQLLTDQGIHQEKILVR
ncbi:MAG: T9SS type A sorting domain-containing protein [Flavobacteriales bacterium]|nr:T9SS type A sorting domain-containing protein [Bacteroidota bacterium]MCB9241848.1 T9SS type A sorting domain-containing protein [Flavobacteriales bacterium]